MFEIASEGTNRLSQLTTEFLDDARLRPLQFEELDVNDVVGYVADASRMHPGTKRLALNWMCQPHSRRVPTRCKLQQGLMNVLLTAVDASPVDGAVRIRVGNHGENIHIDMENAGGPVAQPALNRLSEPFFTTKPRGTGLGLAIARNISRAQGGNLVLSANETGRGCFSLILPRLCPLLKAQGN
jgi:signal transduction histidine kinase